jgi:predicted AlkP superfamily pyrophosphatase or phosphodiesterase
MKRVGVAALLAAAVVLSCASGPKSASINRPGKSAVIEHVVFVTLDAFSETDRAVLAGLPNFSRLMREGSYSYAVRSVWPTLTYVAHTTMQTGRSPGVHGVVHNNPYRL